MLKYVYHVLKIESRSGENLYDFEYLSMLKNKHDEYLTSTDDDN